MQSKKTYHGLFFIQSVLVEIAPNPRDGERERERERGGGYVHRLPTSQAGADNSGGNHAGSEVCRSSVAKARRSPPIPSILIHDGGCLRQRRGFQKMPVIAADQANCKHSENQFLQDSVIQQRYLFPCVCVCVCV